MSEIIIFVHVTQNFCYTVLTKKCVAFTKKNHVVLNNASLLTNLFVKISISFL